MFHKIVFTSLFVESLSATLSTLCVCAHMCMCECACVCVLRDLMDLVEILMKTMNPFSTGKHTSAYACALCTLFQRVLGVP